MEIIKLNLIPSGVNPVCHAKQYDEGRVIRIDLFDGLTPYVLKSGDTVSLNVRKPDNTIIDTTITATQGNTYVNIETTEQMCAVVGYNLCTLKITNGSVDIGTLNFIMQVARDVLADGIPSQSVIEDLDALVQEAVGDNYYTKSEIDNAINPINSKVSDLSDDLIDVETALGYTLYESVSDYNVNQKRAYVYGNFKAGQKVKFYAKGTAVTAHNGIVVRYDDGSTTIDYIVNNGTEKTAILDRNTTCLIFLVNNINITTSGTIVCHVETGVKIEIESLNDDIDEVNGKIDNTNDYVEGVKEAVNLAKEGIDTFLLYGEISIGGLNPDGTLKPTQTTRVSSANLSKISFDRDITVNVKDGYRWGYIPFTGSIAGEWSSWFTTTVTIPAGTTFVIQISRDPEGTTEANLLEFVNAITFDTAIMEEIDTNKHFANGINFISKAGEGLGVPYESLIGIKTAYKNGYDGYRLNICKTSDGYYVLSHDRSINSIARNADGTTISSTINIDEHTLAELNEYDYGIRWGSLYAGLKITLAKDAISLCAKLGLMLVIEWKFPTLTLQDAENIYKLVVTNGYSNKKWHWNIPSNSATMLGYVKQVCEYVDILVVTSPSEVNYEYIQSAMTGKNNVIAGYLSSMLSESDIVALRKLNVTQTYGTASTASKMIECIESGVTNLECNFTFPKRALIDYALAMTATE